MLRNALVLAATLMLAAPAYAQDETPGPTVQMPAAETLLTESINLDLVEGSLIPDECHYPETITDTIRFELACVTMPRFAGGQVAAQYLGQLGQNGWRQGNYISGGMTAVRTDENNCENVLNIFPGDYPPGAANSEIVVIWFARERAPRCPA